MSLASSSYEVQRNMGKPKPQNPGFRKLDPQTLLMLNLTYPLVFSIVNWLSHLYHLISRLNYLPCQKKLYAALPEIKKLKALN